LPVRLKVGWDTNEDLMTSKIISRAACLAEITSNPKSFFNCPDLHGGSGLPERARSREQGATSKELEDGRSERSETLKTEMLKAERLRCEPDRHSENAPATTD